MATHKFKVGHVYSVEYDDHYSQDRINRDDEDGKPAVLRTRGVVLRDTPKVLVLEGQVVQSDRHASNKRVDVNGIMKSCITKVQHYGPEKM